MTRLSYLPPDPEWDITDWTVTGDMRPSIDDVPFADDFGDENYDAAAKLEGQFPSVEFDCETSQFWAMCPDEETAKRLVEAAELIANPPPVPTYTSPDVDHRGIFRLDLSYEETKLVQEALVAAGNRASDRHGEAAAAKFDDLLDATDNAFGSMTAKRAAEVVTGVKH